VTERPDVRRELPWSWHRSPGWRGQLERVRRWHRRVNTAATPHDAEDYLYAFLQNCYHLRDWISAEGGPPVDRLFDDIEELRLCRDVCNMTKHRHLTRPPATGAEPSLAREYAGQGRGWFGDDSTLVILSAGKKWDARELAGRCLAAWEDFLREEGAAQQ
jgi:hypothetical protein